MSGNPNSGRKPKNQRPLKLVPNCRPSSDKPTRPSFMTSRAKAEWDRMIDTLTTSGVVGTLDRGILAGCCQYWANYIDALEILTKEGWVLKTESGYHQPHPYVAILNSSWDRYLKACHELGLTPAARSKLDVNTKPQETGRSKYIGNG